MSRCVVGCLDTSIHGKMLDGYISRWSYPNRPILLPKPTRVGRLSELNAKRVWTSQAIDDLLDYELEFGVNEVTHALRVDIEYDLATWGVDPQKCTRLLMLLNN